VRSLREAFDCLSDLTPGEQERRISLLELDGDQLGQLRSMLGADRTGMLPIDTPVDALVEQLHADVGDPAHLIGCTLGSFRIVGLLGEGGSASVFAAERDAGDGLQAVALKVLRPGVASSRAQLRFRRECSILAQLRHPDIARLIEGGVSATGIPYIAIERVDGKPITDAASSRSQRSSAAVREALPCRKCGACGTRHSS
jgi:eukaryotic-like serine/threonine-protein kinase